MREDVLTFMYGQYEITIGNVKYLEIESDSLTEKYKAKKKIQKIQKIQYVLFRVFNPNDENDKNNQTTLIPLEQFIPFAKEKFNIEWY